MKTFKHIHSESPGDYYPLPVETETTEPEFNNAEVTEIEHILDQTNYQLFSLMSI
jgi:hypothetical protein